ncbi:hypothetical protein D7X96_09585 [Corallococcus interemptor]|uniref:Type I restriction modification DNA specificity domain-containing protein n=1 Tax=Corallococcus interemptor TaxID=2316720 RepID=A0A3A8R6J1_9BACT|nr:restriction endonuclease subunit S [Corallococcus interemptor]RKH71024.1 hypothetical protein D7X96_09585 [Corallococcus interemptor]
MTHEKLPAGWSRAPLSEIADINPNSFSEPPQDHDLVSFVPMAAVEEESGRMQPNTHRPWSEVKKGYTLFQEGDVLFAKVTPCMENGKVAIATQLKGGRGAGSTEFFVLRSKGEVDPKYLMHFVLQSSFRRDARAAMQGAAGLLRVRKEFMQSAQVPIAPLQEQHRIVAELEKQFARIEAGVEALRRVQLQLRRYQASVLKAACEGHLVPTEAELARRENRDYEPADKLLARILKERRAHWESDQLAKMKATGKPPKNDKWKERYAEPLMPSTNGLFNLPEGWVWASLDQLTTFVTSGSRGWAEHYSDSGPLFIRAQDIKKDMLQLDAVASVSPPANAEGIRTRVASGDLLITITGANVTKSALVPNSIPEAYVSQHVGLARPVDTNTSAFLFAWVVSPANGRRYLENCAYGAGKPGLNLEQLRELVIALPPLKEQRRIMAEAESRMSLAKSGNMSIQTNVSRANQLRQTVLRQAFAGNLVSQVRTDEPAIDPLARTSANMKSKTTPKQDQSQKIITAPKMKAAR